jgi:hypothetical protein
MDYPRCKTCKWWSDEEPRDSRIEGRLKVCICPHIIDLTNIPAERRLDEHDHLEVGQDEAAHADGSDYLSEFYTGPDFGCIHHEPIG